MSATSSAEKRELFSHYKGPIISDLSLNNGDQLMSEFPQVKGAFSTVFPSPKKTYEVFIKDPAFREDIESLFYKIDLSVLEVSKAGFGFVFGRTIVQIINEAWFALEDELATDKAIDTAMLFGVNYPVGPLAWGRQAGLSNVVLLLNELYKETNNERYRPCHKLIEVSQ
ncbi:MAG: 3-hydroxybutyryl-CoA dehydrogenase [Bacteriovoracaceae bacterium]|jgi:3-hydroxybutyryl-CoA dehydrogenase